MLGKLSEEWWVALVETEFANNNKQPRFKCECIPKMGGKY